MIPGLVIVRKPMETYLCVREADGDRELNADECEKLYDLALSRAGGGLEAKELVKSLRDWQVFIHGHDWDNTSAILLEAADFIQHQAAQLEAVQDELGQAQVRIETDSRIEADLRARLAAAQQ